MARLAHIAQKGIYRSIETLQAQVNRAEAILRAAALAVYSPELMADAAATYFGREQPFTVPSQVDAGLYPFEQDALAQYFPKPPGRMFVPGVGGGREALALLDLGYAVESVEPAERLFLHARENLAPRNSRVRRLTVQAWAQGAYEEHYDGVLTGWTLWANLIHERDRIEVLEAFRRCAPTGPVLLSFWPTEEARSQGRAERWLAQAFRTRAMRLPALERGTEWWRGMYAHRVSREELDREARQAGYDVAKFGVDPKAGAHAVLTPR